MTKGGDLVKMLHVRPFTVIRQAQLSALVFKIFLRSFFFSVRLFFSEGIPSFPGGSEVKASAWNEGDPGLTPWVGKIPWRRKWQPTPVLLPGESHGGRSLVGCSPWGHKQWDTTERLHFHFLSFSEGIEI